jgi:hypothetical protein
MSFIQSMKFNLPFRLGAGILIAACLSATIHAQNVGIGTASPASKLSVNGNMSLGDTTYTGATAPTGGAIFQGEIGIGTNAPLAGYKVHTFASGYNLTLLESGGVGGGVPELQLRNDSTTNRQSLIEMTDPTTNKGFQIAVDSSANDTNAFAISDRTSNAVRLYIDPVGNIGIGTSAPLAPLYVALSSSFTENNVTQSLFYYGSASALSHNIGISGPNSGSAIFLDAIWSGGSVVSFSGSLTASDARLKNIIGHSDSAKDLETLEKIEITDYTMKDVVKEGDAPLKKVIAQQVEEVYPTAVKTIGCKGFTFTPDIYAVSSSVKSEGQNTYTIRLAKTHGVKEGETVRLITEKNPELSVVANVVDDKTFTVTTQEALGDEVFVYGKQCMDLRSVDYDAIAMLNVSATQELAKKVEALEAENARLKAESARLTALEAQNTKLAAEMEALEQSVALSHRKSGDDTTTQTVVLNQ